MAKVRDEGEGRYLFYCPGCDHLHVFFVNSPHWHKDSAGWSFNGDLNNPTFNPSLLNTTGTYADPNWKGPDNEKDYTKPPYSTRCHLFVQNGVINYCGDCTHEYNGKQNVQMREI